MGFPFSIFSSNILMHGFLNFFSPGFGFGTQPTTTTSSGFSFGKLGLGLVIYSVCNHAVMKQQFALY